MSPRLQHYGLQGLLLIGLAHVALAYVSTVTNWKAWILIVVFPFIIALICNKVLRSKDAFALPAICVGLSIALCAFGIIQFMGIVTNPFYMAMNPSSLALPAVAIVVTVIGYGLAYRARVITEKV